MIRISILACALALGICSLSVAEDTFTLERTENGVAVKINGQLFTEYLVKSGNKPVLWPLVGPTGELLTRNYPLQDVDGEEKDHIHQRSLWFTHGSVNGISFWDEMPESGFIVHRKFDIIQETPVPTIVTSNDWISRSGEKVCEDKRTLKFTTPGESRVIDFIVEIKASEGPVKFGETKEGSFGIRMADTIRVNAKLGGKIVNSEGQTDDSAWGQPAAWVDYHGPVKDRIVGIAILNHPSSFRYPTHWHVRTYGLFAANPWGLKDFGKPGDGSFTLPEGESVRLKYRVVLHNGDEQQAGIAQLFDAYAQELTVP